MQQNEEKFKLEKGLEIFSYILGVIFVVSLIPIILLSTYNFPCADDLGYSIYTRHAWVDTHNLFSVLGAAGRKVAESYQIWQGTWASIFLMALQPGILRMEHIGLEH